MPSMHRLLLLTLAFGLAGCSANPRALPMFDGDTGASMSWEELLQRCSPAEVIIIGELHGHPDVHRFQAALVDDVASSAPQMALSLEMLERDEQELVDQWMRGDLDQGTFAANTGSVNWAGKGSWERCYQPVLDAARKGGGSIVAANAPRAVVRAARLEGFDSIDVDPDHYALPENLQFPGYRERFFDLMRENRDHDVTDEEILDVFRAQTVWDATMARSIADAHQGGAAVVIHLVGCFHSDFDGGTVQELRRLVPGVRLVTISLVETRDWALAEENHNRATVVVHVAPY